MKTIAIPTLAALLAVASAPALAAGKPCEELKSEIAARIEANKGKATLEIVANDQVGDRKVIGSCENGSKKIVVAK